MVLQKKFMDWQDKRIATHAEIVKDFEDMIDNLYFKNKKCAAWNIYQYKVGLEKSRIRLNLLGSCVFGFMFQMTVSFLLLVIQYILGENGSYQEELSFLCICAIIGFLLFVIIYLIALKIYSSDMLSYEVKEHRFEELCRKDE